VDGGVAAGGTIHMGEAAASPLRLKVARERNFSSSSRAVVLSLMQCNICRQPQAKPSCVNLLG
jgi:hypothetical protein